MGILDKCVFEWWTMHPTGRELLRKVDPKRDLVPDDSFAVDFPERGVFVNQHKLAVAECPGVH